MVAGKNTNTATESKTDSLSTGVLYNLFREAWAKIVSPVLKKGALQVILDSPFFMAFYVRSIFAGTIYTSIQIED